MVAIGAVGTFVVAALASLFMAWAIGAGSSGSTPFAPAVGANAISVMRAGFIVGLLGFGGAILQGANVTNAVGNELIGGVTLTAPAAVVALLTAAVLVALGVFAGYPIATAFTVTGAVVGVGLAMGGTPAWPKYQQIATLWVLTPFVGGSAAYATARGLRAERISEVWAVPALAGLVGVLVANMEFAAFAGPGESDSIARLAARSLVVSASVGTETLWFVASMLAVGLVAAAVVGRWVTVDVASGQQRFLLVLGGLVAFSAGGSQVGLAIGPLVPLLDVVTVPLPALLVGGGLGLLAGSWTGAPRMIKALAQDYSSLGPRRSIAAMIPSFAIAQTAVALGVPVSFNEIIVSAIIGSGYAASGAGVSGRKMLYTVLAWIGSLLLAFTLSYGGFTLVSSVLSV
ncbi:inorganic phosphate transporter family protein [Haloferax larsenii]|uniref:Phosphate transporter n=1 Tax=Haloferax larsenii TaxID=302484 RepID=A0ABY5RJR1_HALLR|nr:inorganic phosphate transporter [Haloferax larsenii]UVE51410.1 inorganic phosphate transporter family protein [Haloferax larsenii]